MNDPNRLPLPSEDEGNLVNEPATGMSDDPLVASEEGVPYDPPTDRVMTQPRLDEGGSDWAGSPPDDAAALAADESISVPDDEPRRDDGLLAAVLAELRASDVVAGDRIEVAVRGTTVYLRGEVESIDVGDEIAGMVGDVPGVDEVVDETSVAGL
jgi:hypothetical protein